MALQTLPTSAYAAVRKNKSAFYPGAKRDGGELRPVLKNKIAFPACLAKDATVFTAGSCFARNIEKYLHLQGLKVPMREWLAYREAHDKSVNPEYLNKYTVHSINNELRWALGDTDFDETKHLHKISEDRLYDPQSSPSPHGADVPTMKMRRDKVTELFSTFREADAHVVTLGLVEAWYDREAELILNFHPHPKTISREPDRFELRVLDYGEVLNSLIDFRHLVKKHGKADAPVIVSVSPVPLAMTFRDQDVVQANTYSKSVLRAAAEGFVNMFDDCHYFPSYEIATSSDPSLVFLEDNRHVRDELVAYIIFRFLSVAADFEFDKQAYIDEHIPDEVLRHAALSFVT